jgi:hypothetical protein
MRWPYRPDWAAIHAQWAPTAAAAPTRRAQGLTGACNRGHDPQMAPRQWPLAAGAGGLGRQRLRLQLRV